MRKVLFLCTGNYYRSRFAEALFNDLARERGLDWRAESRGLGIAPHINPGPISPHALQGLRARKILLGEARAPAQVCAEDAAGCQFIVALKEAEHRPMIQGRYPWASRVEYWAVHDLDQAPPEEALAEIEVQVRALVERLGRTKNVERRT